MNIHEFQAKQLLGRNGVAVPNGTICATPEEVRAAAEKLLAGGAKIVVVKSQIHAGGRGKGTFKSGYKGGVKVVSSAEAAFEAGRSMLGEVLVTKQTGPEGRVVSKVLVDPGSDIKKTAAGKVFPNRLQAETRRLVSAGAECHSGFNANDQPVMSFT